MREFMGRAELRKLAKHGLEKVFGPGLRNSTAKTAIVDAASGYGYRLTYFGTPYNKHMQCLADKETGKCTFTFAFNKFATSTKSVEKAEALARTHGFMRSTTVNERMIYTPKLKSNGSKQPSNEALANKLFIESTHDRDLQNNLHHVKDYFEKRKKRGDYDRELAIKALTNVMLPVAKKDKSNHYSPATRILAARLLMESIEAEGKSAVQRNPSKKIHLETARDELQKAYNHMSNARTATTRKSKEDRLVKALDSISRSMISFENAGEAHSDEYHQAKDLQSNAKMHMSSLK